MPEREVTISTHNGSAYSREHNKRNPKVIAREPHIDYQGEHEIWLDEEPKKAYERIFGEAVREYNERQTKEDRKIKSYYQQVANDEQKHPVYEMIIGIYGTKEDGTAICTKEEGKAIMKAFVSSWKERNPNLELIGAYYHADEEGAPHCHLDYIPVASGYQRGMKLRNGIAKALQLQGFKARGSHDTEQIQWEARENQVLGGLCASLGLTVLHPGTKQSHMETAVYKATQELDRLKRDIEQSTKELVELVTERELVADDLATIQNRKSLSKAVEEAYKGGDKKIEILGSTEEKKTFTGKTIPATVTIKKTDFEELKERAASADWVRKAIQKIQELYRKFYEELNHKKKVVELRKEAEEYQELYRSAESRCKVREQQLIETKRELAELEQTMQTIPVDYQHTVYDVVRYTIEEKRERERDLDRRDTR